MNIRHGVQNLVLIKVNGPDHPGITAALMQVIASRHIPLQDVEQVVIQGQLTLCILLELSGVSEAKDAVLKDLLFEAKKLGMQLDFSVLDASHAKDLENRRLFVITLLGSPISAEAMSRIASILAAHNANIDSIRRLSSAQELVSLEIAISMPEEGASRQAVKEQLIGQVHELGIDVAVQREALTRRNKRLVVMDMDSTLIQAEVIDELAKLRGVEDQVAEITGRAMQGELDFAESLQKRVSLLSGLNSESCLEVLERISLTEGAETFIRVLKELGYQIGIISGGFDFAAQHLQKKLGLDFAFANQLDIQNGLLTGQVVGDIIDAQGKAALLQHIAKTNDIPISQTVAIGDGANDALMLASAGLGIAFHAKPFLKKQAETAVSSGGLERVLYLLGMTAREVAEVMSSKL